MRFSQFGLKELVKFYFSDIGSMRKMQAYIYMCVLAYSSAFEYTKTSVCAIDMMRVLCLSC